MNRTPHSKETKLKISQKLKLAHLRPNNKFRETPLDIQFVTQLYWDERMSIHEIAEVFGVKESVVRARMRKYNIPCRPTGTGTKRSLSGILNPSWKGGRYKHSQGYILVYDPGHPRASRNYVLEHIKVWEKYNGLLPEGFLIHHLNGIKDDNRPENLCALSNSKHTQLERGEPYKKRIRELETKLEEIWV